MHLSPDPLRAPAPLGLTRTRLRRRLMVVGAPLVLALSLAACGQPLAAPQRCDGAAPAQRVLVSFRQATQADASAVIEQLQTRAGACVRPVSSVSPTLHVYLVSGPADIAVLRERWLAWPAVLAVEADALMRRH